MSPRLASGSFVVLAGLLSCDSDPVTVRATEGALRIADVHAGRFVPGEDVQLAEVIVSSPSLHDPTRTGLLVTVQDDLVPFSALEMRLPAGTVVPPVGTLVSVLGRVQVRFGVTELEVNDAAQLVVLGGTAELPATPVDLAADVLGDGWISMLVAVRDIGIVDRGLGRRDPVLGNGWLLGGSYVEVPTPEAGSRFATLQGILRWEDGALRLCPRDPSDWDVAPVLEEGR